MYTKGTDRSTLGFYQTHLGQGEGTIHCEKPVKILFDVVKATLSLALKKNGDLWVWGYNLNCNIGLPEDVKVAYTPVLLMTDVTFAVTNDGTLYGWGRDFGGMLGTDNGIELSPGILKEASYSAGFEVQPSPAVIARNVKNLYLPYLPLQGYYTDNNDALWAWGGGVLGTGEEVPLEANVPYCEAAAKLLKETAIEQSEPAKILENIRCVVGDDYGYTYALAMDGTYYRWGGDLSTRAKTYGEANVIVFCTFKPDGTQDRITGVWSSLIDTGYTGELGEPDEEIIGGIGYVYSLTLTPEPCEFPG